MAGKLTDNSIIWFGKYKGTKLANVPAGYLKYIYDNNYCTLDLAKYISENMDVIEKEINENKFYGQQ